MCRGLSFQGDGSAVHLGWVSPGASLLFFPHPHMPASDPKNVTFCPSVPGQSPQSCHLLLEADHPLASGWSLLWLLLGAQKGHLAGSNWVSKQRLLLACSFVTATHSDAALTIKATVSCLPHIAGPSGCSEG